MVSMGLNKIPDIYMYPWFGNELFLCGARIEYGILQTLLWATYGESALERVQPTDIQHLKPIVPQHYFVCHAAAPLRFKPTC